MAGHLDMWRLRGAPPITDTALRDHLSELAALRGSAPWFDAFTPFDIPGTEPRLHLDVITKDQAWGTVVFVPGTNAYALLYGEFLTALAARGLNVVGLDPRGHGRSGGLRGSYSLAEIIEDVGAAVRWARARFHGPVFLAGSSQGGIAAFYYAAGQGWIDTNAGDPSLANADRAADHDHVRVDGIVCHNIADLSDAGSVRCMRHPRLGAVLRPHMSALAQRWPELPLPMSAYLDLEREPVRGARSAAAILLGDPLTVPFIRLRALASLADGPMPAPAGHVRCPLFVLHAERDAIFPEDYVASVFARVPSGNKRMKTYPGLAHYMVVDDVPAFVDDVTGWLRRQAEHAALAADAPSGGEREPGSCNSTN